MDGFSATINTVNDWTAMLICYFLAQPLYANKGATFTA